MSSPLNNSIWHMLTTEINMICKVKFIIAHLTHCSLFQYISKLYILYFKYAFLFHSPPEYVFFRGDLLDVIHRVNTVNIGFRKYRAPYSHILLRFCRLYCGRFDFKLTISTCVHDCVAQFTRCMSGQNRITRHKIQEVLL